MKKRSLKNSLVLVLSIVLVAAMALIQTGCGQKGGNSTAVSQETDVTVLGEGAKTFGVVVVDGEGAETTFEIHTDETTVGAALVALDLISGDESEYGLYVKVVNGITADWDTDGTYWAFYINDEYATAGVDATDIEEGVTYKFVVSNQ